MNYILGALVLVAIASATCTVMHIIRAYRRSTLNSVRHHTDSLTPLVEPRDPTQPLTIVEQLELYRLHKKWSNKDEEIPNLYSRPVCLKCGSLSLLEGPSGGLSVNMKCADCGATWNVMPMPPGVEIEPI